MALLGSVKDNGKVYVITESVGLPCRASRKSDENLQMWVPSDCKHTILAADCEPHKIHALKSIENLISPREDKLGIVKDYLLKRVVPHIVEEFYRLEFLKDDPFQTIEASLLIANKDRVYFLGNKGTIREIGDFDFFNYGSSFLLAAMDELKDVPVIDRLLISVLRFDEEYYPVRFPIVINDTESLKPQFFAREDCLKAYQAYKEEK